MRSGTLHIHPELQLRENGHATVEPACLTFKATAPQCEGQAHRQLWLKVWVLTDHKCAMQ